MADVVVKASCDQTTVEVYTCPPSDITVVNGGGGGGITNFASREETDAGVILDKALNPDVGAYAYDRLRWPNQHEAGKGTAAVVLTPVSGVVTLDTFLSNVFELDLTENVTFADSPGMFSGQVVNTLIRQDATGGWTADFGPMWTFVNRVDPTITPDANATDMLSCQWDATRSKWRCALQPNYGTGYTSPDAALYENVGGGSGVYRDTTVVLGAPTVNLRTLVGLGDIEVLQSADSITIDYTGVPGATELNGLTDVDISAGVLTNGELYYDGSMFVPRAARLWTVGTTWTNGSLPIAPPVNLTNVVIPEACKIVGVYVLTQGGAGSCLIDIRKTTFAAFPPGTGDTIVAAAAPEIIAGVKYYDTALTDWLIDLAPDDILQFVLSSSSSFTVINVALVLQRVGA
jgi:hypothetical protein